MPRDPNKAALLMSGDRRIREEELSILYDEFGFQAESMIQLLNVLQFDEVDGDIAVTVGKDSGEA